MQDGTPVDLVLNPLGVPSRMNVGQILETHLGSCVLGAQIQYMIDAKFPMSKTREHLLKIFGHGDGGEEMTTFLNKLSEDEIKSIAFKLRRGVFFGSPVFDGAEEADIKNALGIAGLPGTGQAIMFDGRTGDAFDNEVTVGVMYMLKLHHSRWSKPSVRAAIVRSG